MKVLLLGLNYSPEPVGIGPYTTGLATFLAERGHHVTVIAGKPYYPFWKIDPAFKGFGYRESRENGVSIVRCPIYVPPNPTGIRRLLHHFSFAISGLPKMLGAARRLRPDIVLAIAPSLIAAVVASLAARLVGARYWLHVQDFEVEAAFATGLLRNNGVAAHFARAFEIASLRAADKVSTISPKMCNKLAEKGVPVDRIVEFRNWANIEQIQPLCHESPYRAEWDIDQPYVALYSGNIANKQGIELIVDTARLLLDRTDLIFVICGNGAGRERLEARAASLSNVRFFDLQPEGRLSELLGTATLHLLPQLADAADLVLPSKLGNMLASGRPVIATAHADTGVAHEVEGCGLIVPPGNAEALAKAISILLDSSATRVSLGAAARARAEARWCKKNILNAAELNIGEALGG